MRFVSSEFCTVPYESETTRMLIRSCKDKLTIAALVSTVLAALVVLHWDYNRPFRSRPTPIPGHFPIKASSNQLSFDEKSADNHTSAKTIINKKETISADDMNIAQRFKERRRLLRDACSRPNIKRRSFLDFFFKNRTNWVIPGRLHWCRIPKVGTTFIKWNLESSLDEWKREHSEEFRSKWKFGAKSFLFVREPYSRLFSGYIDKILTTPCWWDTYLAKHIGKLARPNDPEVCAGELTFPEFIKYFIHAETTGEGRDVHFIPIHNQCDLCRLNYHYIGHLETFSEDLTYVLKSAGVDIPIVATDVVEECSSKIYQGLRYERRYIDECTTVYTFLQSVWLSFQARGFIWDGVDLPITEDQAGKVTPKQFVTLVKNTIEVYKDRFDKRQQRFEIMTRHYLSVPLEDRLKLMEIFQEDFEMFHYEELPPNLFPELGGMN